jgi:hypothetical protein
MKLELALEWGGRLGYNPPTAPWAQLPSPSLLLLLLLRLLLKLLPQMLCE